MKVTLNRNAITVRGTHIVIAGGLWFYTNDDSGNRASFHVHQEKFADYPDVHKVTIHRVYSSKSIREEFLVTKEIEVELKE